MAYRSPKKGLTRGVSQKELASEACRAVGGVARNTIGPKNNYIPSRYSSELIAFDVM